MFDDPFSGLDKVTEEAVFTRVFSADGLLRRFGTTVILATHAGMFLHLSMNLYSRQMI